MVHHSGGAIVSPWAAFRMDPEHLTYPDGYSQPGEAVFEDWLELVWHSSEICSNCFQRIRHVGEEHTKTLETSKHRPLSAGPPLRITITDYHERTEHAVQEHDPFSLPTDRFGQCYCLDCGGDTKDTGDPCDRETLIHRAKNICRYVSRETDAAIDGKAMGRALYALKAEPENQGYDSEILAAATCVGLQRADTEADAKPEVTA